MKRSGEIIEFDDLDKARYRGFPDWAPIEAIPGLFEDVADKLVASDAAIPLAQSTESRGDACLRSFMIRQALEEMLDLAGCEIVDAQLASVNS